MRPRSFSPLIAIILITGAFFVGVIAIALSQSLVRDFDPILYTSRSGLCSVPPLGEHTPYCPNVRLDQASFSPDGHLIAAVRSSAVIPEIVITNRKGEILRSLPNSGGFIRPTWSPDGLYVLALSYDMPELIARWHPVDGPRYDIAVKGFDDNCKADEGRSLYQSISVSPSGRKLALLCNFRRIFLANIEENVISIQHVSALPFSYFGLPTWLDEESLLVVARRRTGATANLWRLGSDLGSAELIPVLELSLRDYVAVSPDGRAVAVTGMLPGERKWSLWRVDLSSSVPERLTQGEEDTAPTWAR